MIELSSAASEDAIASAAAARCSNSGEKATAVKLEAPFFPISCPPPLPPLAFAIGRGDGMEAGVPSFGIITPSTIV